MLRAGHAKKCVSCEVPRSSSNRSPWGCRSGRNTSPPSWRLPPATILQTKIWTPCWMSLNRYVLQAWIPLVSVWWLTCTREQARPMCMCSSRMSTSSPANTSTQHLQDGSETSILCEIHGTGARAGDALTIPGVHGPCSRAQAHLRMPRASGQGWLLRPTPGRCWRQW